jgi:hypothetical protein
MVSSLLIGLDDLTGTEALNKLFKLLDEIAEMGLNHCLQRCGRLFEVAKDESRRLDVYLLKKCIQ